MTYSKGSGADRVPAGTPVVWAGVARSGERRGCPGSALEPDVPPLQSQCLAATEAGVHEEANSGAYRLDVPTMPWTIGPGEGRSELLPADRFVAVKAVGAGELDLSPRGWKPGMPRSLRRRLDEVMVPFFWPRPVTGPGGGRGPPTGRTARRRGGGCLAGSGPKAKSAIAPSAANAAAASRTSLSSLAVPAWAAWVTA